MGHPILSLPHTKSEQEEQEPAPFGAPRLAPAEKGVVVEVVLLALRRERQLPRAMLTGIDLRRTFHCWPLCPLFRCVVFQAHRVVD
jgi:hypothetical protein